MVVAPSPQPRRAVVLLSGGLDSTTCAGVAKEMGYDLVALSFDYGQRHHRELQSAELVAAHYDAEHLIMRLDLGKLGGSALTDAHVGVPKDRDGAAMGADIPVTYVPARNTILLSHALAVAEVHDADAIFIGANALDYSGYPDCRPEYFEAFENLANLATKRAVEGRPVKVETPLLRLTKAEIVQLGVRVGAPLYLTWSCYEGGDVACGRCDSCRLRLKGFEEAGERDPIAYANAA